MGLRTLEVAGTCTGADTGVDSWVVANSGTNSWTDMHRGDSG